MDETFIFISTRSIRPSSRFLPVTKQRHVSLYCINNYHAGLLIDLRPVPLVISKLEESHPQKSTWSLGLEVAKRGAKEGRAVSEKNYVRRGHDCINVTALTWNTVGRNCFLVDASFLEISLWAKCNRRRRILFLGTFSFSIKNISYKNVAYSFSRIYLNSKHWRNIGLHIFIS